MDVSIIIVSFNAGDYLNKCLLSIKKETASNYEIIVVDNHSRDDSVDIVKKYYPEVKLVELQENVGFAKANNIAFKAANGCYVFMLNPDTVVLNGAIDKLVQFMDNNKSAGACGPKNLNPDLSLQYNCHHFPSLFLSLWEYLQLKRFFPHSRIFGREHMSYWDYNKVKKVDWITGCSLLIRKKVLDRIGFLDENYFMYSEECDLCFRIKKNNYLTLFYPGASIVHYGGQSSLKQEQQKSFSKTIVKYLFQSRYYFYRKNYGKSWEILLRLLDMIYFGISFIKNKVFFLKKNRKERIALAEEILRTTLLHN